MQRHPFNWLCLLMLSSAGPTVLGCQSNKDKPAQSAPEAKGPALQHGLTEEQGKKVLAKVGDTEITVADFAERLSAQSPYLRSRYSSPERRREFLDSMVRFELL